MAVGDLTTLANVKAFLGVTATTSDAFLQSRIAAVSGQIRGWLSRSSLLSQSYTDTYDGTGGRKLMLRNWPVTAISALTINGTSIAAGSYPAGSSGGVVSFDGDFLDAWDGLPPGYYFSTWDGYAPGRRIPLELNGFRFYRGSQNIQVTYTAGYRRTEAFTLASPYTVTLAQSEGIFAADAGVTYASGVALIPVTSSPATGQYVPPALTAPGLYTFAAGDSGAVVTVAYSFVPAALEQACIDAVAWYYFQQQQSILGAANVRRLGAGGTTIEFGPIDGKTFISPGITAMLQPFRRVS